MDSKSKGETILLRVKRPREADDLDQICKLFLLYLFFTDLEFDNVGKIKRTKMVTEKDAI